MTKGALVRRLNYIELSASFHETVYHLLAMPNTPRTHVVDLQPPLVR